MELKDFVRETLHQIVEGVAEAQAKISGKGAVINPSKVKFFKDGKWSNYHQAMPQEVEFDVGLTAIDKSGSAEGIGVFLGSINLGKKNNTATESVAITKVKFSVPLVLPEGPSIEEKSS